MFIYVLHLPPSISQSIPGTYRLRAATLTPNRPMTVAQFGHFNLCPSIDCVAQPTDSSAKLSALRQPRDLAITHQLRRRCVA